MVEITKDTIIGDILDIAPADRARSSCRHRDALPGLPRVPRRDRGGGLHGPRRGRGQAPALVNEEANKARRGITGQDGRRIRSYASFFCCKERSRRDNENLSLQPRLALLAVAGAAGRSCSPMSAPTTATYRSACWQRGVIDRAIAVRHAGGSRWSTRRRTAGGIRASDGIDLPALRRDLTPLRRRSADTVAHRRHGRRDHLRASSPRRPGRATGGTRCCSSRMTADRGAAALAAARTATPSRARSLCATRERLYVMLAVTAGRCDSSPGAEQLYGGLALEGEDALCGDVSRPSDRASAPAGPGGPAAGPAAGERGRLCRAAGGRAGSK